MSQIPPPANACSACPPHHTPPIPATCTLTLKLSHILTHPIATSLTFLLAFTLLIYGLYLLTPNLRRPKQKPLRSTPLMEYNAAFGKLVVDL
ncbi:hypothetical protein DL95DRAFT_378042, partial [Leptodontidium sp. 2 PMI_412]